MNQHVENIDQGNILHACKSLSFLYPVVSYPYPICHVIKLNIKTMANITVYNVINKVINNQPNEKI